LPILPKTMKRIFNMLALFLLPLGLFSQVRDSAIFIPMFTGSYSFQIPGGELKDRYGPNSNVSVSFLVKNKKGILYGLGADFLFGSNLKPEARGVLDSLRLDNGEILNDNGEYAKIVMSERGFYLWGKAGYLLPVRKINPNSGFLFTVSTGLFQHKIRIENDGNNTYQILGDYKKGYDRLTNGLAVSEFCGFMFFGKRQVVNFFAGFEFQQAWTRCRRDFNFDTRVKDNHLRTDLLYGFRIGWMVPLYKRMSTGYYYN
jgi:hypothetical protein